MLRVTRVLKMSRSVHLLTCCGMGLAWGISLTGPIAVFGRGQPVVRSASWASFGLRYVEV